MVVARLASCHSSLSSSLSPQLHIAIRDTPLLSVFTSTMFYSCLRPPSCPWGLDTLWPHVVIRDPLVAVLPRLLVVVCSFMKSLHFCTSLPLLPAWSVYSHFYRPCYFYTNIVFGRLLVFAATNWFDGLGAVGLPILHKFYQLPYYCFCPCESCVVAIVLTSCCDLNEVVIRRAGHGSPCNSFLCRT